MVASGSANDPILVGDVGGTNVRFALANNEADGTITLHHIRRYAVKAFDHFNDAVTAYCSEIDVMPRRASFAFAGPKFDDAVRMTNVNWIVARAELCKIFGFDDVTVLNDFVAMANGTASLPPDAFQTVLPGEADPAGPVAVLGPGTGLGLACILPGEPFSILPTEGGHTAFTPQSDLEIEILRFWTDRIPFVSAEALISGPGLHRTYTALCHVRGETARFDTPGAIVDAAGHDHPLAAETVSVFCNMLGTFASNSCLTLGTSGGVVLSGGVSRHIAPFMATSDFETRFRDRGHGAWFVKDVPVRLTVVDDAALYGAAAFVRSA